MRRYLSKHRCIDIRREVDRVNMWTVEDEFDLILYDGGVDARGEFIPIEYVFDMSFYVKQTGKEGIVFLYLHTNQGIKVYKTKKDPEDFIYKYRQLKQ